MVECSATILLTHSPSQKLNQQRLENYLSASGQPDLDIAVHLANSPVEKTKRARASGTDTPKDLNARIKILELFTLHVLPRNEEWEYAKEFISLSDVLDDERKEAFLLTLDGLREEKEQGELKAAELQRQRDEELERQHREDEEFAAAANASENNNINGTATGPRKSEDGTSPGKSRSNAAAIKSAIKSSSRAGPSSGSSSGTNTRKQTNPSTPKSPSRLPAPFRQLKLLSNLLVLFVRNLSRSLSANPLYFLRSLLLILGVVMALGRPDVRERLRRVTGAGWRKVAGTVGMGVKVSYI